MKLSHLGSEYGVTGSCHLMRADGLTIMVDPAPPSTADLVVMESTFGDRLLEPRDQQVRQPGDILSRALADDGKVFIPAFFLGRAKGADL